MNRRDFISGGLGAAALAACSKGQPTAPDVFDGQLAALTADLLEAQPEAGLFWGVAGAARDRLSDRSPRAAELRRAASLRRAAQWRGDDDQKQESAADEQSSRRLIITSPSAHARPLLESAGSILSTGSRPMRPITCKAPA